MKKYLIALILLILGSQQITQAQKFALEIDMGGRSDLNNTIFQQGEIWEIKDERLHFQAKLLYHFSEKIFFSGGIGLNQYGIKTRRGSSAFNFFPTSFNEKFLIGIPLNINYRLPLFRKLDLEVGGGLQLLFTEKNDETRSFGMIELDFNDPENDVVRERTVSPRNFHLIPNIHSRLVYNFSPKFAAYFQYQYSQGLGTVFSRTVEFNDRGNTGKMIIDTKGTALQTAFGIRFTFKDKERETTKIIKL